MTLEAEFAARFPGLTASVFNGNMSDLANYQPSADSTVTGLMGDIGKVMVYNPDVQTNPYSKYIQSPLSRGDAVMSMRFKDITSHAYDKHAPDTVLFNQPYGEAVTNVAKMNLSRQIGLAINRRDLLKYQQVPEMAGDVAAALQATMTQAYNQDMWIACREYYSNLRNAKADQMIVMTEDPASKDGAAELNEILWKTTQNYSGYLDTRFNQSGIATKSDSMDVFLEKSIEYPLFKRMLSETYNPEMLRVSANFQYVPEFGSVIAGKPSDAGKMIATITDPRKRKITPLPEALVTSSFVNPARLESVIFETFEYILQEDPFFNAFYVFQAA